MNWKTRLIKRVVDVGLAGAGIVMTAPLFPVIALAVKATSPGPVFYRQKRCGVERRSGIAPSRPPTQERRQANRFHTFDMVKFRTMRTDAEAKSGPVLAQKNDHRLTPIGGFLRKSRLDELPQLFHVLTGDMSIVGPRPERPELLVKVADAIPFFEERMRLIKPGLTGLAQISLGYDGAAEASAGAIASFLRSAVEGDDELAQFANKLLFDLAYSAILENPTETLKTDLEVIVKTPIVMLTGKGR